jgi:hypothetical protein
MTELLYEFKQGNKVLTKIYKENNKYHVYIPIGRGGELVKDGKLYKTIAA